MRNLGILISALSVAAGIIAGRFQYESERNASRDQDDPAVYDPGIAVDPRSGVPPPRASRRRGPGSRAVLPPEDDARAESTSREAPAPAIASGQRSPTGHSTGDDEDMRREIATVRSLLDRHEFERARTEAEALASRLAASSPVRSEALRLAAKARVFLDLIGTIETDAAPPGDEMKELKLANGNTIVATSVEKRDDHYEIELARGGSFAPLLEDVLEIKAASREQFLEDEWRRLEPKVAKIDNAIDLFVHGVQDCYRRGMKSQGHRLLERLLAMPDSDTIPLVFIPDSDEDDLLAWRVASGRLDPLVAENARRAPAPASPAGGPVSLDPDAVERAARLLEEAEELYRNAARREGREHELVTARTRLDEALAILEALPPQEDVVKLRRRLSTLLHDVVRSLPF